MKKKPIKVVHAMLEHATDDSDVPVLALYFDRQPTDAEVRKACLCNDNMGLSVDLDDEYCEWKLAPTPVSRAAKLFRVEATPLG